jgi:hypothetical protein
LDTLTSQPTEKITIMPPPSGKTTGLNTEKLTQMIKTAQSPSLTTGKVPNNALNHGNAEVQDFAREEDGALDMMVVKEPHSQTKPQDSHQTTDRPSCDSENPVNQYI